ncbi:MAG: Gfo/Idh/MocA family oxidoreductase [Clostridia bacterium]|jgi:predicted dehydrogenase
MNNKIRVGIIGTGNISTYHMAGYKKLSDKCEVVAVCDIDEEKVKNYAEKYDVKAYYTDYNKMLFEHELDAVSVCTWNSAHKDAVIAALNSHANVICEKPMAINRFQAVEMEQAAIKNDRLLMIGFVRRFGNDAKILKSFIDNGSLGNIYYAKATYLRRNGCPGGWFKDSKYSGGGPLIDLGVHVMDLVRYLSNNPKPISVYGATYSNLGLDRAIGAKGYVIEDHSKFKFSVEDMATALVRFDNGLTMFVEASFNLNIKQDTNVIELFGTKGGAKIDPNIEFYMDMNGRFVDVKPHGDSALSFSGLFESEIDHFVDCVVNKTPCRATAEDGVMLMKIIDAIYESAELKREVSIE